MLKVRIIPTLLWKGSGLVKGVAFDSWRRVGSVLPAIKVYNLRDVDEMIVVDITATEENREPDYESITEFCDACFVPLTVGGGVKSIAHIRKLLESGADKVAVNTSAMDDPQFVRQAAERYGAQCIVASIDARKTGDGYECFTHSGKQATGKDPVDWARKLEELGAGELLLTSIERDGTMQGYDLELIARVTSAVAIPVIASGGAGSYEHMFQALSEAKADAVAAASIFHFTEQTPLEAKNFLREKGIAVRRSA